MADEVLKRDDNRIPVIGAITNDASQEVRMLRVDPTTGRLLISATIPAGSLGIVATAPLLGTGTTLSPLNLGGLTGVVQGDLMYATGTNALATLAKATLGVQFLSNKGVGNNPIYSTITLSTDVTGILPLANGGTNKNMTPLAGGIVWTDSDSMEVIAAGTSGKALISGGAGAPTWFTPTAGSVLFAGTGGILAEKNSDFFWDNTNFFLGLGTTVPTHKLHLNVGTSVGIATHYTNGITGALVTDGSIVGLDANGNLVMTNFESALSTILSSNGKTVALDFNGNIRTSALHNNATAQGNANEMDIRSGTYTPTLANQTNLDGTATVTSSQWMRVGNVVTVSGQFTADPTLTATATLFTLTLPVASNIANVFNLVGNATCGNIASMSAAIQGNIAGDLATVRWISTDITSQTWGFMFTYVVLN